MSIFETALKQWDARELTAADAPHILEAWQNLARDSGIVAPKLYIINDKIFHNLPNAGALGKGIMIMNHAFLKAMGTALDQPPSRELLAVFAHELSHSSHAGGEMATKLLPIFLTPIAAFIGMAIYDASKKTAGEDPVTHDHIDGHIDSERQKLKEASENQQHPHGDMATQLMNDLLTAARYIAVTAAGLSGGLLVARFASRHFEFRADKHAAKLVGPEAMIAALEQVQKSALEIYRSGGHSKPNWFARVAHMTIQAHPTIPERIERLRAM